MPDDHTPIPASERPPAEYLALQLYGMSAVRRELARLAAQAIDSHGFLMLAATRRLGPARVSVLAAELQVDISVASRQIAGLEREGLVERAPDPADGRAQLVACTQAGRDAIERAHHRMVGRLEEAVADWDETEVVALAAGLERVLSVLAGPPATASTPTSSAATTQEVPA